MQVRSLPAPFCPWQGCPRRRDCVKKRANVSSQFCWAGRVSWSGGLPPPNVSFFRRRRRLATVTWHNFLVWSGPRLPSWPPVPSRLPVPIPAPSWLPDTRCFFVSVPSWLPVLFWRCLRGLPLLRLKQGLADRPGNFFRRRLCGSLAPLARPCFGGPQARPHLSGGAVLDNPAFDPIPGGGDRRRHAFYPVRAEIDLRKLPFAGLG
jgi:hypothetical protein